MKKLLFILLVLSFAVSCEKGDEPLFAIQTFVSAENGKLVGDSGETFIPKDNMGADLSSGRFFMSAYAIEDLGGNNFKVLLISLQKATLKAAIPNSGIESQDEIGHDPIVPGGGYAAGRHLNLMVQFIYSDPEIKHTVNLVYDDVKSNTDTLYFDLRHNAHNDTLGCEGFPTDKMQAGYSYVSFDIFDFAPKEKNSVVITLRNKWYKTSPSGYIAETEDQARYVKYSY